MRDVRIDLAALRAMHEAARSCPVETGGICVGPDERTISEYIPSGPDAERTASSYALDVEYLQPRLAAAEDRGLRFVGVHHVHPEGCQRPSQTDAQAVASILADPNWNVRTLLLPLTVRVRGGVETAVFVAESPSAAISEARLVVGSDFSPNPNSAQRRAATKKEQASDCLLGPSRIERELVTLRARGCEVGVASRSERSTNVQVSRAGRRIDLVLPPEFPLSPPDVFFERSGTRTRLTASSLPVILGWSSLHTLAEVIAEASDAIEALASSTRTPLRRALGSRRSSVGKKGRQGHEFLP